MSHDPCRFAHLPLEYQSSIIPKAPPSAPKSKTISEIGEQPRDAKEYVEEEPPVPVAYRRTGSKSPSSRTDSVIEVLDDSFPPISARYPQKKITQQEGNNNINLAAIWDQLSPSSDHEYNDSFEAEYVPHHEENGLPSQLDKEQEAKRLAAKNYSQGIAHLSGIGASKNIEAGIQFVEKAAQLGSEVARRTLPKLGKVYNQKLITPPQQQLEWLMSALSDIEPERTEALDILKDVFGDRVETKAAESFIASRYGQDSWGDSPWVTYDDDILPKFALGDPTMFKQHFAIASAGNPENQELALECEVTSNHYGGDQVQRRIYGTYLHFAAYFGHEEIVRYLVHSRYSVNTKNDLNTLKTPLLCALRHNHPAIAEFLLDQNADCSSVSMMDAYSSDTGTPSPFHYLVYIKDEEAVKKLAAKIARNGGDIHAIWKQTFGPNVTPLRLAIIHEKPQVVESLLRLDARFGSSKVNRYKPVRTLLLETRCTNLRILRAYFAQLVPGQYVLPKDFAFTPLGLLLAEEDSPERRLRRGFGSEEAVRDALELLLELQPGWESHVFSAIVRHDHLDLARHLFVDKLWDVESRWKGLTPLHLAVLHGRNQMCDLLLKLGADPAALTTRRKLTCYHLMALWPRGRQTDMWVLESLSRYRSRIPLEARESTDGVTALHLAVRNRFIHQVDYLVSEGASVLVRVDDQLDLLAEGRSGRFNKTDSPLRVFHKPISILAEVMLQHLLHSVYSVAYMASVFQTLASSKTEELEQLFFVDEDQDISIVHLIASMEPVAFRTLFPLAIERFGRKLCLEHADSRGDTPLHYACAAIEDVSITALLGAGADPYAQNSLGNIPLDILGWAPFFLGFHHFSKMQIYDYYSPFDAQPEEVTAEDLIEPKIGQSLASSKYKSIVRAIEVFASRGFLLDLRLERLAVAWTQFETAVDIGEMSRGLDDERIGVALELVPVAYSAESIQEWFQNSGTEYSLEDVKSFIEIKEDDTSKSKSVTGPEKESNKYLRRRNRRRANSLFGDSEPPLSEKMRHHYLTLTESYCSCGQSYCNCKMVRDI